MIIEGERFTFIDTIEHPITVADSWVVPSNKLGEGNGEAKLYIGSRDNMEDFYGGKSFRASCFVLKKDLIAYMQTMKAEYNNPSQSYRKRFELSTLWKERMDKRIKCISCSRRGYRHEHDDDDHVCSQRGGHS